MNSEFQTTVKYSELRCIIYTWYGLRIPDYNKLVIGKIR